MWEDDREEIEKEAYSCLIAAIDRFLSGRGHAKGGLSRCAWAVKPEDASDMLKWVQDRSEMKHITVNYDNNWNPSSYKHVHVYIAKRGEHPALPARSES